MFVCLCERKNILFYSSFLRILNDCENRWDGNERAIIIKDVFAFLVGREVVK